MKLFLVTKKSFIVLGLAVIALFGVILYPKFIVAQGNATLLSGNIMTGGNRSHPTVDWTDPVDALPGDAVEFRIVAQNIAPNTTATNVTVTASLPSTPATVITATGVVSADNAASVSDTVTVNVTGGEQQGFAYIPGHARIFSNACPSGCSAPDTVTTSGINVGNLAFGDSAQVLFKAYVTNNAPPVTPTPTPTGVPTPTPTGMPTATPTPTGAVVTPTPTGQNILQCPAGFVATISGSNIICVQQVQNQNQSQSTSSNASTGAINVNVGGSTQTVNIPPPITVTQQVTQLPKTGLPLAVWLFSVLLPAGIGIKKFGSKGQSQTENARYLCQRRKLLKED